MYQKAIKVTVDGPREPRSKTKLHTDDRHIHSLHPHSHIHPHNHHGPGPLDMAPLIEGRPCISDPLRERQMPHLAELERLRQHSNTINISNNITINNTINTTTPPEHNNNNNNNIRNKPGSVLDGVSIPASWTIQPSPSSPHNHGHHSLERSEHERRQLDTHYHPAEHHHALEQHHRHDHHNHQQQQTLHGSNIHSTHGEPGLHHLTHPSPSNGMEISVSGRRCPPYETTPYRRDIEPMDVRGHDDHSRLDTHIRGDFPHGAFELGRLQDPPMLSDGRSSPLLIDSRINTIDVVRNESFVQERIAVTRREEFRAEGDTRFSISESQRRLYEDDLHKMSHLGNQSEVHSKEPIRSHVESMVTMTLNPRFELNSHLNLPQRLNFNHTNTNIGPETPMLSVPLNHGFGGHNGAEKTYRNPGKNEEMFSGRRSTLPFHPLSTISSLTQPHTMSSITAQAPLQLIQSLPSPPPPVICNSSLSILKESQEIHNSNSLQQSMHLQSGNCERLELQKNADGHSAQHISTRSSRERSPPSLHQAMNLSVSEPGVSWDRRRDVNHAETFRQEHRESHDNGSVLRPSPVSVASIIGNRPSPSKNRYALDTNRPSQDRHADVPPAITTSRSPMDRDPNTLTHTDLLTPFTTAPYLAPTQTYIYPPLFSASAASVAHSQLFLPSGDKTYEILGGPGAPPLHPQSHAMFVQGLRDSSSHDLGDGVTRAGTLYPDTNISTSKSTELSRSQTDGKYFKRRLSTSRSYEDRPNIDALRSVRHQHSLPLTYDRTTAMEEPRGPTGVCAVGYHDTRNKDFKSNPESKQFSKFIEDSALSPYRDYSVHNLQRLDKPVPLLFSSSPTFSAPMPSMTRFSLDRKYTDLELVEGPARSDVMMYPVTPSASSASSHGGRSDSSRSPISRRGSEEQMDHVTVWRPY